LMLNEIWLILRGCCNMIGGVVHYIMETYLTV
jgi:hypothetical protein